MSMKNVDKPFKLHLPTLSEFLAEQKKPCARENCRAIRRVRNELMASGFEMTREKSTPVFGRILDLRETAWKRTRLA